VSPRNSKDYAQLVQTLVASSAVAPGQSLLVTSCLSSPHKTTTAIGLALTLARSGRPTLLAGADLGSSLADEFDLHASDALTRLLAGEQLESPVDTVEVEPGLRILPTSLSGVGRSASSDARAWEKALDAIARVGAIVIVDGPPVLDAPEAAALCSTVGSVVLVVDKGATRKEDVRRAAAVVDGEGPRLRGVVIAE